MEEELFHCLRPDVPGAHKIDMNLSVEFQAFPVFGFHHSSSFMDTWEEKTKDPSSGAKEDRSSTQYIATANPDAAKTEVVTRSHNSLEVKCALEILSIFMLDLTADISTFSGKNDARPRASAISWLDLSAPVFENSTINGLVNMLVDCILALFPEKLVAEVMVISPLAKRGLLKTFVEGT